MNTQTFEYVQQLMATHFEKRLAEWTGNQELSFRQLHGRAERPTVWEIWVVGDTYYTRHGLLGGKMQETSKKGKLKNGGKTNEVTPEMDALAEARRLARKKWDFEGYDQHVGDVNIDQRGGTPSIPHLLASLPGSFCMYKPQNNIEDCKSLLKLAAAKKVRYTLKRNGLAMWIVKGADGLVHMYSRRNRPGHKDEGPKELPDGTMSFDGYTPWAARFPHLDAAVHSLNLPPNSMMAVELVSTQGDTKKHFAHVQGVEKSLTPRAKELQETNGYLGFYWWDIPFLDGKDLVSTETVEERHQLIYRYHSAANVENMSMAGWIQPVYWQEFDSPEEAKEYAKENNLEGWVVVDPQGIYGDKAWNLKGKPDRPGKFCAKLKPEWEDDFVALFDPDNGWGEWGKGRHEKGKPAVMKGEPVLDGEGKPVMHGGVGSVGLGQYRDGELVYICDCSSGMDYEYQAQLDPERSFPIVCEVKYNDRSWTARGDKTDALSFPVFVRERADKGASECCYSPEGKAG